MSHPNLDFSPVKTPICRVLPTYVANHYDEFFMLTVPRYLPKVPLEEYVAKLKKKITCMIDDLSV